MKENYLILIHSDGKPYAVEVPEKPEFCETDCDPSSSNICDCARQLKNYNEARNLAIEDVSKFIMFKDSVGVEKILSENFFITTVDGRLDIGQTFSIPSGYSLKIEYECSIDDGGITKLCKDVTKCICVHDGTLRRVAILIKSEEPKEEGCICQGCQKSFKIDLIIPDELWAKKLAEDIQRIVNGEKAKARRETYIECINELDKYGHHGSARILMEKLKNS